MNSQKKNIVCFGGGSAISQALFPELKNYPFQITLVNSMVDSGGSTGWLRRELNVLPPGDLRRHILLLSNAPSWKKRLWEFRFGKEKFKGGHKGHNFANILIAALEQVMDDYQKVLEMIHEFMEVKPHKALPATIEKTNLCAVLENGEIITGEDEIDVPHNHNPNLSIREIFLNPKTKAYLPTLKAIEEADVIIIGPGDLYSSILPCFLPSGIKEALKVSDAKKIYICNLMTKKGETQGFFVYDFVKEIESYIGNSVDFVVYNNKVPRQERVERFKKENPSVLELVRAKKNLNKKKFIGADLISEKGPIIHSSQKVVKIITSLI
ncbi:YvcK family protein [bacterium]|nr:YvcK family protein [bacterium]